MIRVVDKDNNEIVCYKYKDGTQVYGICESTFRKRAREAGATIKLGKTVLIRKDIFEEYLFSFTVPAME